MGSGNFALVRDWLGKLHQFSFARRLPAGMLSATQLSYEGSDGRRGQGNIFNFYQAPQANLLDGMQSAANGASALSAIRIATEDTRLDPSSKIGTIVCGHPREHAFCRIRWRRQYSASNAIAHQKFRMTGSGFEKLSGHRFAVHGSQYFRRPL